MVRFRVTLLVLMGGLVLLSVSAVGVSSYLNSRSAANELSDQVLEQTALRIHQQVDQLLNQATTQNSLTQERLSSGQLTARDSAGLVAYWLNVMPVQSELTSLFIGLESTGESAGVSRLRGGNLSVWQTTRNPATAKLDLREYRAADYPRQPFKSGEIGPDIRTRPWYASARQQNRAIWTQTYVFLGVEGVDNVLGVTHAVPVHNPDGTLQAVLSADFDLGTLSRFLASLRVGQKGSAFLVEQGLDGNLHVIAHPRSEHLVRPSQSGGGRSELVPVNEFEDGRVRAFLSQLPELTTPGAAPQAGAVRFNIDGQNYLGTFSRVSGDSRPPWVVCTFVPEDEVLAYANRSNRLTAVIALIVFALAVVLTIILARQVAQPLELLAADALAAGHLRLVSRSPIHSVVLEVDRLARASEEMKSGLRSFEKYVPTDLVRDLIASGQEARLGGEKREMSIAFSDIAGFTAIAETMSSEELVAHLGEYLGALCEEILLTEGTVDKFIGDSIMAFWGAPVASPRHAASACEAAYRCQQRLKELRQQWQAAGKPAFHTRFGLHTGEVIVGNIGSPARMNYTVIGDAVNLASRLEGLNKHYGTEILLSEQTYREAGESIIARPVDLVAVSGRGEAVWVYELLGLASEAGPEIKQLATLYASALSAYRNRQWAEAMVLLEDVLRLRPGDGPSVMLKARCLEYQQVPPGDEWDGVRRWTSK